MVTENAKTSVPDKETGPQRRGGSHQVCTRCVMDTTAPDIVFDYNGVCNYCTRYLASCSDILFQPGAERAADRDGLIAMVKASGRGKPYDCVVGVSGGGG